MAFPEEPDPRTGKAPKHQQAARGSRKNRKGKKPISKIDFKETMYIGYKTVPSGVEFMEIEMKISKTGKINEVSMSGTEGEIMKTDVLEKKVKEYWEDVDLESEYGYLADDVIGEEPDEDDIDKEMSWDAPDYGEKGYEEARDEAYEDAKTALQERRDDYLEAIKTESIESYYPWEWHNEKRINNEFYMLTAHSGGQVLDRAKDYTSVIPESDLDFIVKAWQKHHLYGFFGNDEEVGRSEPTLETMQRLITIYKEYESRDGDEGHIKKIVDATGI